MNHKMNRMHSSHVPDSKGGRRMSAYPLPVALCLLAIYLGGSTGSAPAAEPSWKAGVARAVITPEKPVWLAGYGSKRPPDGKLHDLWMKALALEDGDGGGDVGVEPAGADIAGGQVLD